MRMSPTDRELWQQYADQEFSGKLGAMIRAGVTAYVTDAIESRERIDLILELQTIRAQLNAMQESILNLRKGDTISINEGNAQNELLNDGNEEGDLSAFDRSNDEDEPMDDWGRTPTDPDDLVNLKDEDLEDLPFD